MKKKKKEEKIFHSDVPTAQMFYSCGDMTGERCDYTNNTNIADNTNNTDIADNTDNTAVTVAILTRLRLRDTSTSIDGKNWIILSDMIKFKAYFQELLLCPRINVASKIVFRGQNNLDL